MFSYFNRSGILFDHIALPFPLLMPPIQWQFDSKNSHLVQWMLDPTEEFNEYKHEAENSAINEESHKLQFQIESPIGFRIVTCKNQVQPNFDH